jgi:hypothetical protein
VRAEKKHLFFIPKRMFFYIFSVVATRSLCGRTKCILPRDVACECVSDYDLALLLFVVRALASILKPIEKAVAWHPVYSSPTLFAKKHNYFVKKGNKMHTKLNPHARMSQMGRVSAIFPKCEKFTTVSSKHAFSQPQIELN